MEDVDLEDQKLKLNLYDQKGIQFVYSYILTSLYSCFNQDFLQNSYNLNYIVF